MLNFEYTYLIHLYPYPHTYIEGVNMTQDELKLLTIIIVIWKQEIDKMAGGYISTQYSKLQWEMKELIDWLNEKIDE
jgi:hypothetical protein